MRSGYAAQVLLEPLIAPSHVLWWPHELITPIGAGVNEAVLSTLTLLRSHHTVFNWVRHGLQAVRWGAPLLFAPPQALQAAWGC